MNDSTKKLGTMFTIIGWIIALVLVAFAFSKILDRQHNPNQSVSTLQTASYDEIILTRGRGGHYLFKGEINHQAVTFLVDTGATTTAIPGELHISLGLQAGPKTTVSTANGDTTAYLTRLDHLAIGEMTFNDVNASIIPGMAIDEVLLGMNILRHLELIQRGNELIIRRYH